MAKVLISFLGTGPLDASPTKARRYKDAEYELDGNRYRSSFVSTIIKQVHQVDKVLLIGTVHSMWEEVYNVYANQKGCYDEDTHINIGVRCDESGANTPFENLDNVKGEIEEAIGGGSKMVLVKYGLNSAELRENASIILGLEDELKNGDELIVDVTHSFRSLPLYIMNLLIYLRNVSDKHIKISHIYYGMLDLRRENNNVAPIVDITDMMTLNDWISAAHSFAKFGNGYKIAELLRDEGDEAAATAIKNFSDVKNLNHLVAMQHQYSALNSYSDIKGDWSAIANAIVPKVINQFRTKTYVEQQNTYRTSDFQFKIAKWHCEHLNFFAAYTNLSEAVVSRCAEFVLSYNGERSELVDDFHFREAVKDYLKGVARKWEYDILNGWSRLWNDIAPRRNTLAHAIGEGRESVSAQQMITDIKDFIARYPMLKQKQNTAICSAEVYKVVMSNYNARIAR